MTKDEAIQVCVAVLAPYLDRASAEQLRDIAEMEVDMFTRLGMLTLSPQGSAE